MSKRDEYRLISTDASAYGIESYGVRTYWNNDEYIEEKIDTSGTFKSLKKLLLKERRV